MKKSIIFIILLSLSLFFFSCLQRREIKVESDKGIIENMLREFVQALKLEERDKLLTFYLKSPDIVLIGTGDEYLSGYDAIENFYKDSILIPAKGRKRDFFLSELKVKLIDGVAWFSSKLVERFELKGKRQEKKIRFTGVLIKEEGSWKFVQTNMSLPSK